MHSRLTRLDGTKGYALCFLALIIYYLTGYYYLILFLFFFRLERFQNSDVPCYFYEPMKTPEACIKSEIVVFIPNFWATERRCLVVCKSCLCMRSYAVIFYCFQCFLCFHPFSFRNWSSGYGSNSKFFWAVNCSNVS